MARLSECYSMAQRVIFGLKRRLSKLRNVNISMLIPAPTSLVKFVRFLENNCLKICVRIHQNADRFGLLGSVEMMDLQSWEERMKDAPETAQNVPEMRVCREPLKYSGF